MIGVKWPNGQIDTAATWEDMESLLRSRQWEESPDAASFRAEMQTRSYRWSGVEIEVDGSSRDFFLELERAAMLIVLHWVPIEVGRG